MRILVNYDKAHAAYKATIAGLLKNKGYQGLSTDKTLEVGELQAAAKNTQCSGILLCNEETLQNCIQSSKKVTLDKYRGTRLNFTIPAIVGAPLNHLRIVRHGRWLYEKDLDKFKSIGIPVTQMKWLLCDTRERLELLLITAAASLIISIDIETDAYNRITCISYTLLNTNFTVSCFLIPFIDFTVDHYANDPDMYAEALSTMQQISALPIYKLFFNGPYDAKYLIKYHAEPLNYVCDSMALAHAEFAELPKTLDFVSSIHLYDYYFWKDEADDNRKKNDIHGYWSYCVRDSFNTLRSFLSQLKTAKPYAIKNYQQLFKMVYPFMYMGFEGCLLDQAKLRENRTKAQEIVDKTKAAIRTMAALPDFNPSSPKQVAILLYDVLGAKIITRRKRKANGELSDGKATDEKTLIKLADQHPIIKLFTERLLEYRGEAKAISTYFDFPQWEGRVLYEVNPFGTDTGRGSSRQSSFRLYDILETKEADRIKSYGAQIQNIPPYAKSMLIPDEGYEIGEADNNKSEARCVALLSACKGLIVALEDRERDFYRVLGTIFFGLEYKDVSTELRNKVLKRIVHGRNYLMGADTFIETAGSKQLYEGARLLNYQIKTLKEFATYLLNQYNKPFPEIAQWYNEIKLEVVRNQTLTSPTKYTRYFFGDILKDHKVFRNAVAHAPQNLSVMILNKGVWRVYKELVLPLHGQFRLKAQIHDSIFFQNKIEIHDYVIAKMKECMDNPVTVKSKVLSIPVDINTSPKSWYELKS